MNRMKRLLVLLSKLCVVLMLVAFVPRMDYSHLGHWVGVLFLVAMLLR